MSNENLGESDGLARTLSNGSFYLIFRRCPRYKKIIEKEDFIIADAGLSPFAFTAKPFALSESVDNELAALFF